VAGNENLKTNAGMPGCIYFVNTLWESAWKAGDRAGICGFVGFSGISNDRLKWTLETGVGNSLLRMSLNKRRCDAGESESLPIH
jgi:hypothetical protein